MEALNEEPVLLGRFSWEEITEVGHSLLVGIGRYSVVKIHTSKGEKHKVRTG